VLKEGSNHEWEVSTMPNLGIQRQRTMQGTVEVNEPVLFNQSIVNDDDNINYLNGVFTFDSPGKYYVSWFVSLKTTLGIMGPEFAIVTNEEPAVTYSASSGMKTTQVSGFALLEVKDCFSFRLINKSEGEASFTDNADVTAGIAIVNVTPFEVKKQTFGGIQLQLIGAGGTNLAVLLPIPFDHVVKSFSEDIKNNSGVIEFCSNGRYLVDWWVGISGSTNAESIRFTLIDCSKGVILGESFSPVVLPNVFYGNTIIEVTNAPMNISLTNNSGATLTFAPTLRQAGMRIVELVGK